MRVMQPPLLAIDAICRSCWYQTSSKPFENMFVLIPPIYLAREFRAMPKTENS